MTSVNLTGYMDFTATKKRFFTVLLINGKFVSSIIEIQRESLSDNNMAVCLKWIESGQYYSYLP